MIFLVIIPIIMFEMLAGQFNKYWRFGIPLSLGLGWVLWHNHPWFSILPSLMYFGILLIGNWPNSKLMKWLGEEQSVRMGYGCLLALPVVFTVSLTQNWLSLITYPLVVASCMARMGSLGKIGKFDILPTDILRGLALGFSMSCALI